MVGAEGDRSHTATISVGGEACQGTYMSGAIPLTAPHGASGAISAVCGAGAASPYHRAVDEVLVQHPRMEAVRGRLRHENPDEPLLRIDPEARPPGARPHGVALRPRHPGEALIEPHAEAQTEAVARTRRRDRRTAHADRMVDRKSTRLNSSHRCTSYAVFCLNKKSVL